LDHVNGRRLLRPADVHIPNDFPEQHIIADLLEDTRGSLWIAAPSGLYRRWPDGSAARYTKRDGLPGEYLQDLMEDHEGHLWAGTRTNGFFRFRVDTTHRAPVVDLKFMHAPSSPNDLPSATSWVYQLFETSDDRFWVATARGLVEFFPSADERHRFRSWAPRNGLTDNGITALNEDLGGNLWLGTTNSGVMKLTRGGFSTYDRHDGIESLNAMFEDRAGHLCFRGNLLGDARGYTVFDGAKLDVLRGDQAFWWARLGCLDGQRFDWFFPAAVARGVGWVMEDVTLQARNGEWWVGTGEGLFRFPVTDRPAQLRTARPLAVYRAKNGLALPQVFRLFEDSRGNIWISTIDAATNGLDRWESSDERIHDLAGVPGLPSLKDNLPRSFGEDRAGNIWIGFEDILVRFAAGSFKSFSTSDGLPTGKIRNIYVDHSGRLWLASDGGGLVRVDNPGGERPTFVSYTTARGLSSNNPRVVVEDFSGRLYVGGGHGLDRFDPATGRVKHFTTADGLAPGIIVAAFRDRSGVL
ncbi:MAG: two-component regulator propeller domain-containing protein, partial [Gemmatimonadaceae bacterium]